MKNENRASRKGSFFWTTPKTPRSDAPARAQGLRKRSFEIIRKPDLIGSSFLFNNVQVRYVATCPVTGVSFYVNNGQGGIIGVRVYPDGRQVVVNPNFSQLKPCKKKRTEGYLQFRHAWGKQLQIFASHAVYIAWRNKEIPAGMTIDHINGVTTDNDFRNLRCVTMAVNERDGGFLRKLRNKGINPPEIRRSYLLRYFDRMAHIKANISSHRYDHLDKEDLEILLYYTDQAAALVLNKKYNLQLNFQPS
ncbi:MAG: HNH endonuclease [Paludibacteraceae bacterium]|nr:HNH endonuclease [Paludibacteraceae bacterium]